MLDIDDEEIRRGNSADIIAIVRTMGGSATPTDPDLTLTSPDSHSIKVYDADGNLDATYTDPTEISTGFFKKSISVALSGAVGTWRVIWQTGIDSDSWDESITFRVLP